MQQRHEKKGSVLVWRQRRTPPGEKPRRGLARRRNRGRSGGDGRGTLRLQLDAWLLASARSTPPDGQAEQRPRRGADGLETRHEEFAARHRRPALATRGCDQTGVVRQL